MNNYTFHAPMQCHGSRPRHPPFAPANANPNNGNSPLRNPFQLRADGTRFDVPTGSTPGSMARPGGGFTCTDFNQPHARQQRWRAGVQGQIGKNMVVEAAYSGT